MNSLGGWLSDTCFVAPWTPINLPLSGAGPDNLQHSSITVVTHRYILKIIKENLRDERMPLSGVSVPYCFIRPEWLSQGGRFTDLAWSTAKKVENSHWKNSDTLALSSLSQFHSGFLKPTGFYILWLICSHMQGHTNALWKKNQTEHISWHRADHSFAPCTLSAFMIFLQDLWALTSFTQPASPWSWNSTIANKTCSLVFTISSFKVNFS